MLSQRLKSFRFKTKLWSLIFKYNAAEQWKIAEVNSEEKVNIPAEDG